METSAAQVKREAPWIAGLRAVWANLIPALILQALMLALLLGYYFHTATTVWLDHLANIKLRWGFGYSALSAVIAGTRRWFTAAYARDVMLLVIFANWGVWFPVVAVLYSLPSTLQIPLFGLTLSLWVMLLTWMSELRNHTQD